MVLEISRQISTELQNLGLPTDIALDGLGNAMFGIILRVSRTPEAAQALFDGFYKRWSENCKEGWEAQHATMQ